MKVEAQTYTWLGQYWTICVSLNRFLLKTIRLMSSWINARSILMSKMSSWHHFVIILVQENVTSKKCQKPLDAQEVILEWSWKNLDTSRCPHDKMPKASWCSRGNLVIILTHQDLIINKCQKHLDYKEVILE